MMVLTVCLDRHISYAISVVDREHDQYISSRSHRGTSYVGRRSRFITTFCCGLIPQRCSRDRTVEYEIPALSAISRYVNPASRILIISPWVKPLLLVHA